MITPSELTTRLVNMGYNPELSAPLIANTYLKHKKTGDPLPISWEYSTVKDVQTCYNKLMTEFKLCQN